MQSDEGKRAELEALGDDAIVEEDEADTTVEPPENPIRLLFYNICTSKARIHLMAVLGPDFVVTALPVPLLLCLRAFASSLPGG